jgi:hypothetical protein
MTRYLLAVILVGGIVALTSSSSQAGQPLRIMAGDPSGRNVVFSFDHGGGSAEALRIETQQTGNPGAKLSIWVDHSSSRLFSRILTSKDCIYGDSGARCRFEISKKSPDYRRFVVAFKRGKTAHIEVQNAGVMQMSKDISLVGFSRKLRSES